MVSMQTRSICFLMWAVVSSSFLIATASTSAQEKKPADGKIADPFGEPPAAKKQQQAGEQPKKKSSDDQATTKKSFMKELDDFEAYLDEYERFGRYGNESVLTIGKELEDEYLKNKASIDRREREGQQPDVELQSRQRLIPVYLWQLQRAGCQIGSGDTTLASPNVRISKLMSSNRELTKDKAVSARISALMRRSSSLSRMRTNSRYIGNFHFVIPGQEQKVSSGIPDFSELRAQLAGKPNKRVISNQFTEHRRDLSRLLKLIWHDGSLIWDREHWKRPFSGKSIDQIEKEIDRLLVRRGIDPPKKRKLPFGQSSQRPFSMLLFENLQHTAGSVSTYTSSLSQMMRGQNNRRQFSNGSFECNIDVSATDVGLLIREFDGQRRLLRIKGADSKKLRVSVMSDERMLLLVQDEGGQVRLIDDTKDETVSIRAESFARLYAKHPDVIEQRLFATLREMAFLLPPTRLDQEMIERALMQVSANDEATIRKFDELMGQIDHGSFAVRDKATKTLQQNIDKFLPMLVQAESDGDLPLEAKSRLKEVMAQYTREVRGVDSMVVAMELADSQDYLIAAMSHASGDDLEKIATTLKELTGEDHGVDVDAWKKWQLAK